MHSAVLVVAVLGVMAVVMVVVMGHMYSTMKTHGLMAGKEFRLNY